MLLCQILLMLVLLLQTALLVIELLGFLEPQLLKLFSLAGQEESFLALLLPLLCNDLAIDVRVEALYDLDGSTLPVLTHLSPV